jgi:guanine deaminase
MTRTVRGRLLSFAGDPAETKDAVRYWPDGVVAIEAGRIAAVGDARAIAPTLPPHTQVDHYTDRLVLPGLIDTHIHSVQVEAIASFGLQLLDWLENYAFVAEQKYAEPAFAARQARFFLDERSWATTARSRRPTSRASGSRLRADGDTQVSARNTPISIFWRDHK